jgi:isoquinoline 1-oxidoreductase beta subunit
MGNIQNVSRRRFLENIVKGTGGLILAIQTNPANVWAAAGGATGFSPNIWLTIATTGDVTIVTHRSEMGTGIRTSLPMVVADELDADWERVTIEQGLGDKKYGSQNTDGSRSIRNFYQTMREAGASARAMLESAAAKKWGGPVSECHASIHTVTGPKGESLGFGDLVETARDLPVPTTESLTFKSADQLRYVGKENVQITDLSDILVGEATFGGDIRLKGMKFASVERCPVLGGKVKTYDATEALAVPGVEKVIELAAFTPPHAFQALGGIAVIGSNTWATFEGRKKLKIDWDLGANTAYDSVAYEAALRESVRKPGRVVRESGDVDAAMAVAADTHEAEYYVPHLAHAPMEPPVATAHTTTDGCTAWAPSQDPQAAQATVAQVLGLEPEKVAVNVTLLGGGFGRKSKPDYVVEAALISREIEAPVQVVWSREDDVRHDYYHSVAAVSLKAGLDDKGRPNAWVQRSTFPSIISTFNPKQVTGHDFELGMGSTDLPFALDNLRCENGEAVAHVRIGWLRSVCNIFHAFGISSFADELAVKAGRDPVDYLLDLIGEPRMIDPTADGAIYPNYDKPLDQYPIDTGRLANVLKLAAEKSGWGRKLPAREGLGIAVHRSFLSYIASVVHVKVADDGSITIPRVDMAYDCGLIVNPDRVRAQMEGSAVFGVSLAMLGEITAKNGAVEQSNFHDYQVSRINEAPKQVVVHSTKSDALPAGVGEPGVPPIAPALCNAIFAATGKRIRTLPISKTDLSG